jgi:hypothetical protein
MNLLQVPPMPLVPVPPMPPMPPVPVPPMPMLPVPPMMPVPPVPPMPLIIPCYFYLVVMIYLLPRLLLSPFAMDSFFVWMRLLSSLLPHHHQRGCRAHYSSSLLVHDPHHDRHGLSLCIQCDFDGPEQMKYLRGLIILCRIMVLFRSNWWQR